MGIRRRQNRYAPGEALAGCSICGGAFLFPSELHYADDKLFYCLLRCWKGKTELQSDREAMASRNRQEVDTPRVPLIRPTEPDSS